MSLVLTVTDAGRAALVNAQNTGTAPVLISQCGVTATAVVPSKTATALPGEIKRIATLSGDVVADDTIHLVIRDQSPDDYSARGLALYLGDGTLFAIYGQADPIVSKTAASMMMLAIDVRFEDIDATSLTFGDANFLNPPATTELQGVVELATVAEAAAGTDPVRAVTPKAVKDAVTAWLDSRFGANNALVWNPNNDGAGSGLDADLLDGLQAAAFLLASAYTAGDVLAKLLTVDGAGSGLDADLLDGLQAADFARLAGAPELPVSDADLLNKSGWYTITSSHSNTPYNTSILLHVERAYSGGRTAFQLALGSDFQLYFRGAAGAVGARSWQDWGMLWHSGIDGAGSGLDADLLDGQQGSYYSNIVARLGYTPLNQATYTAADIRTKLLTVDGAASGIDADLLDGYHGSSYDRVTSQSLVENGGYLVYASGRKECWGYIDMAKDVTVTVTLPTVHSSWVNPIVSATATGIDQTDNAGISSIVSANQFRITNGNVAHRLYWRSIGV